MAQRPRGRVFVGSATGLSIFILRLPDPLRSLEQWAFGLVVVSIPINLRAAIEYGPALAARLGFPDWLVGLGQVRQRVDSVFGNPNVLAAYLVIIFGLGLGLCLQALQSSTEVRAATDLVHRSPSFRGRGFRCPSLRLPWLCGAMALIPVGLFCSGSRNGILVLLIQLLIAMVLLRPYRWAVGLGLRGMVATLSGGGVLGGIGGRTLVQALTSSLIRVEIWEVSLPWIRQYPWFGLGFGGFQAHYEPGTVANIAFLHHVHNLWLHLAVEAGLPVMLLFTGIVGWICHRAVRYYVLGKLSLRAQPLLVGYNLGFLACILFSLFDIPLFDARINLLGWVIRAAFKLCLIWPIRLMSRSLTLFNLRILSPLRHDSACPLAPVAPPGRSTARADSCLYDPSHFVLDQGRLAPTISMAPGVR